ncbi:MAG: hypothetical protein N2C14_12690, partial [Planctomycetales bacterium]
MRNWASGVCWLIAISCWAAPRDGELTSTLTLEDEALIAWFDQLGFPDLSKAKFVNAFTGDHFVNTDGKPTNASDVGFLVKEKGASFTILKLDLREVTLVATPPDTPEHEKVSHEVADLRTIAGRALEYLANPQLNEKDRWLLPYGRVAAFALARACAAKGFDDLAHRLFEVARTNEDWKGEKEKSFQGGLEADFSRIVMRWAMFAIGDPKVSREELLAQFRRVVERFPRGEHAEEAKEAVALLTEMVKEDRRHANRKAKPFEKMTKDEQIAELIFQLRDQTGIGEMIFFPEEEKTTPARRLVEFGYDAVPPLIEVLEDKRFTRSVELDFFGGFLPESVLRVGGCARVIVGEIAGRTFHQASADQGEQQTIKQQIEKWWEEFQQKGE